MPWRMTIPTLVIAGLLSLLAILAGDLGADRVERSGSGPLLESERFPVQELNRIELSRGDDRWIFVREDDGWWQDTPFRAPIEDRHLVDLAERAVDLHVVDRFDGTDSLSEEALQLSPPRATLTFGWPGGTRQFNLGRRGVAGRGYLRIDDSPTILIVNQGLHATTFDTNPTLWREPRLFPGIDIEAQRIQRFGPEANTLERDGRDWRFVEPVATRTDREAMESYIIELARARSAGVILDLPEELSAFGLENPRAMLEVEEQNGTIRRLLIGDRVSGRTQDRYVMLEGTPSVLRVEGRAVAGLFLDPIAIVDPRATGVSGSNVKAIEINGIDSDIRLERDLDRWIAVSHGSVEVPRDRVDALLELLTATPGEAIAIVEEYPQELQQGTITLIGYDRRPLDTIRVLREPQADGWRWGLENGDSVVRIHPLVTDVPLQLSDWGLRSESP
ncbi:MAG: DUF4340 domain-containing protein [Phycisphaerales bacterium]|nr:DUF4340 domain-containing protein [Phycisphaerales bacterium]